MKGKDYLNDLSRWERKIREQSNGWCCELCGRLIKGVCDNDKGIITCLNENCIDEEEE